MKRLRLNLFPELSDTMMLELDRRIQAYEADPTSARPGNEVMAELAKKFSIPHIIGNKPHKRKPKYWRGRKP